MRVLIVRLSSFGDVVHTFPALSDAGRALPEVELDWLVDESFADLARLHPNVGKVIAYAERGLRWPPTRWPARRRARSHLRRCLRERDYGLVVDLQGLLKSALVARLAGRTVAGYDAKSIREPLASRFYAQRHAVARNLHAVERNRRLLAAALGYRVADSVGEFGLAREDVPVAGDVPEPYCLFVHSASWPSKLWAEPNWQALAERVSAGGMHVALPWGSAAEKERAERIARGNSLLYVLPERLDGQALATLLRRARFAVGLDSGLMHLATAFGVPGVWLFGPTDPGLTGPYGPDQTIIRSTSPDAPCRTRDCDHAPAGSRCMDLVEYQRVATAVDGLLPIDRG
jgi:lipopolysaccharide heptosyltransferase I